MSSTQKVEVALDFLRESSDSHARWKGASRAAEEKLKIVEASQFLNAPAGAVDSKRLWARATPEYLRAVGEYDTAVAEFTKLDNLRVYHQLEIEVWRTQEANRRHGL